MNSNKKHDQDQCQKYRTNSMIVFVNLLEGNKNERKAPPSNGRKAGVFRNG